MSVTIVQKGTATPNSTWTSQAVTLASGVTQGNLLVATIGEGSNLATYSPPSGWSTIFSFNDGSASCGVAMFYLVVGAGQAGQTSWTFTATSAHSASIVILELSAGTAWSATPLDVNTDNDGGTGTALDTGSTATTAQADEFVVAVFAYHAAVTTVSSYTSGYTQQENISAHSAGGQAVATAETSATGAQRCQATLASSLDNAGGIAAFKVPSGGTAIHLIANAAPLAASSATLIAQKVLQTAAAGLHAASATLAVQRVLQAHAAALASSSATLVAQKHLVTAASGLASSQATLVAQKALVASGAGLANAHATLQVSSGAVTLQAQVSQLYGIQARLVAQKVLQAHSGSLSAPVTTLVVQRVLQAHGSPLSASSASLVAQKVLQAHVTSTFQVGATLNTGHAVMGTTPDFPHHRFAHHG